MFPEDAPMLNLPLKMLPLHSEDKLSKSKHANNNSEFAIFTCHKIQKHVTVRMQF